MKVREIKKAPINFYDAMDISQDAIMSRLNCHNIGKIIEYDSTTQTCTVQLMVQKQFYNQIITPAPITNVPLIIYGAGNAFITLPDPVGSTCLLMFLDRNSDKFFETGEMYVPETTRTHDFTDCVAITTFSTLNNPIQDYDNTAISIINKKVESDILTRTCDIKNFGNKLNLDFIYYLANNIGKTQIEIEDKIKIKREYNSAVTADLLTIINGFIDLIKTLTTTGNSISAVSKTALDDYKSEFGKLFK